MLSQAFYWKKKKASGEANWKKSYRNGSIVQVPEVSPVVRCEGE